MRFFRRSILIKKKYLKIILPILAAIVIIVVIASLSAGAKERQEKQAAVDAVAEVGILKIGLRGDLGALCTYNTQAKEFEGLEKDVIDEVLSRLFDEDMIITYELVNSNTKDAQIKTGELDIALGASINYKTSSIKFSTSFYADPAGFLVMENGIKSQEDLNGKTIGYVQESYVSRENEDDETKLEVYLETQGITADIKKYASYPETIDALAGGHVSAVCAGGEYMKLFGKKGMVILPERFLPHKYSIETRRSLATFCTAISDVLNEMEQDGTLEKLIDKWGLVDYYELTEGLNE